MKLVTLYGLSRLIIRLFGLTWTTTHPPISTRTFTRRRLHQVFLCQQVGHMNDKWPSLILESRGIHPSACQTVSLSRAKVATVLSAACSSKQTGEVNRAYAEDWQGEIKPVVAVLKVPAQGLFMRLGGCSLKDAASKGQMAVRSTDDAVLQISTSCEPL